MKIIPILLFLLFLASLFSLWGTPQREIATIEQSKQYKEIPAKASYPLPWSESGKFVRLAEQTVDELVMYLRENKVIASIDPFAQVMVITDVKSTDLHDYSLSLSSTFEKLNLYAKRHNIDPDDLRAIGIVYRAKPDVMASGSVYYQYTLPLDNDFIEEYYKADSMLDRSKSLTARLLSDTNDLWMGWSSARPYYGLFGQTEKAITLPTDVAESVWPVWRTIVSETASSKWASLPKSGTPDWDEWLLEVTETFQNISSDENVRLWKTWAKSHENPPWVVESVPCSIKSAEN